MDYTICVLFRQYGVCSRLTTGTANVARVCYDNDGALGKSCQQQQGRHHILTPPIQYALVVLPKYYPEIKL
ncbi:hypothetical protein Hypma_010689 [Hypsizygus marmoreus]|uniref:Uncharacterized protein n=1 Tax=Hypsizygus marmoreus TaxID=39966 RepID=A0A369JNR5_HYPMA|nr:hypothetical protein Hypma_010689 [Hypsizygus marmoreus]